jgi:hypothetical protein
VRAPQKAGREVAEVGLIAPEGRGGADESADHTQTPTDKGGVKGVIWISRAFLAGRSS